MGRKAKYSNELKLEIVKRYLNGESAAALANEYGIPASMESDIIKWSHRYKVLGNTAFVSSSVNKTYSA